MIVVPYCAESHHLIGAAELALMKPTATLTNIARGGIVDDAALAAALRERRIAAAGLDVFEGEPAVHPDLLDRAQRRAHAAHRQRQPADPARDGRARRRQPDRRARPAAGACRRRRCSIREVLARADCRNGPTPADDAGR